MKTNTKYLFVESLVSITLRAHQALMLYSVLRSKTLSHITVRGKKICGVKATKVDSTPPAILSLTKRLVQPVPGKLQVRGWGPNCENAANIWPVAK